MFPTSMSQVELIKSSKIWCQLKQEKIKKKERKKTTTEWIKKEPSVFEPARELIKKEGR